MVILIGMKVTNEVLAVFVVELTSGVLAVVVKELTGVVVVSAELIGVTAAEVDAPKDEEVVEVVVAGDLTMVRTGTVTPGSVPSGPVIAGNVIGTADMSKAKEVKSKFARSKAKISNLAM